MTVTRRIFLRQSAFATGSLAAAPAVARTATDDTIPDQPAYVRLAVSGELDERVDMALSVLERCTLCPHRCEVDRRGGQTGLCAAGARATVYSHTPHFGEELPLVGRRGSGTIFFSHCNLRCVFCQNWPIAHEGRGREVGDHRLAEMMLELQRRGCHNINLVTPTHVMPNILRAIRLAERRGLRLPIVYNTSGYERVEMIRLLDGIVDIYLPDLKFMDGEQSARYAMDGVGDYPETTQQAILEMQRQVGRLVIDSRGIARRGLMIRHLVMPNRMAGSKEFVQWVAENLPLDTYVNIMPQWRVEHRAFEFDQISRAITPNEFLEAMDWAREAGLSNFDQRSLAAESVFRRRAS